MSNATISGSYLKQHQKWIFKSLWAKEQTDLTSNLVAMIIL